MNRATPSFAAALLLGAVSIGCGPALAQTTDPVRELGAHQHGRGQFVMAIEKGRVSIDVEMPAADIVGFEHAAKTDAEREAIEAAKRRLLQPLVLFGLPEAARCKVSESSVELENVDEHDDKPGHKDEKPDSDPKHAEFQAHYMLECATPSALTSLQFKYFEAFTRAQTLEVVVVSEKTQIKAEATRATPKVDLPGLM